MRRTRFRRSGRTSTRASSTTAGTPTGKKFSNARRNWASCPKDAELSRHDPDVADWNKLPANEKKLYARMMEVFAGFLEHTDHHIGELLGFLKELGEQDNTLIMVLSDNGASAEGGPHGSVNENKFFNNVPESGSRTWPRSTKWAGRNTSITIRGAGHSPATHPSGAGSAKPIAAA